MPDTPTMIRQTQKWVLSVVIGQNFCPFAKPEHDANRIHYSVVETGDFSEQLQSIAEHCAALDQDIERETSLLIFPNALTDFDDYLDLLDLANALLTGQGYEGVYQLASFHPDYCFEGVGPDDPSHYTNRSPYPMIHILREASLEAALANYPNPENIPVRNVRRAQSLGLTVMAGLLAACYD